MFKTFINAFKIKDIRKKLLMTLLLIVIYRLGCFIPIPGVNVELLAEAVKQYDILGFLDLLTGSSFSQFSLFAMGISPYITASIILQLLTIAIPALEKLSKEDDGREKIERITRYTGIGLAFIQAIGIFVGLENSARVGTSYLTSAFPKWIALGIIGICATGGTAFLMWLGERITENGIGNGISMLIFASIVSRVPNTVIGWVQQLITGVMPVWAFIVILVLVIAMIALVVCVDQAQRRIPVQYAKRVVGRKMYGGQSTYLPIKANANGVLPLIFAMTLIQFPGMIAQFWPDSGFYSFYTKYLGSTSVVYFIVYAILIVAFGYFYSAITFNPVELSKNLQQNGGFIPGIRPGKPTADYLGRISSRLTLFGSLFLAVIAILPTIALRSLGQTTAFGATSILIMVSVAIETTDQLESHMLMRHYKGFLN
ncbi:MAG: preprotein translocase subunit SecY [Clostridia bacterium]|nr:preprotein translocase subunit SecY [Clostridia bacterium]